MMHEKIAVLSQSANIPVAQRRACVLVLGMHRSGTSALTRVLNLLGCDLPNALMGPGKSNEAGHWESQAIADFNDRLLESAGTSWDDWQAFNPGWFSSPKVVQFREEARALLEQEFGASHFFVLKDPRICRLAEFWLNVLVTAGIAPRVVIPIRNPLEVAQSLAERDGFEPGLGHLLWLRHALEAEFATRGHERVFTSYDRLMTNWASVAAEAAEVLQLSWPRQSLRVDSEIASFLDRNRRHHREAIEDAVANPRLSAWLRSALHIFTDWATSGEKQQDFVLLDRIRAEFDGAAPAFAGLVTFGRAVAQRNAQLEKELNAFNTQVPEKDARIAHLSVAYEALVQTARNSERALAELRSELERTSSEGAQKSNQLERALAALQEQVADRDANLARISAERDAFQRSAAATAERVHELESRVETLKGQLAAREASVDNLAAEHMTIQTRLRDAEADLSEATRTLDALRRAREIVEGQLRASRLKSAEAESKVAEFEARVESFAKEREHYEAAVKEIESRLTTSIDQLEAAKSESESRLAERFFEIAALTRLLGDRDAHIGSMREQIADRDTKLARLSLEKEAENHSLRAQMAENETRLARLSLEKEAENHSLRAQMAENETKLARLSLAQEQATHEAQTLERVLASARSKLADAESSLSERFSEIARITNKFLEKDVLARKFEEHATWLRSMALILVPASRSWRSRLSAWLPLAIHRTRQMNRLHREGIFDAAAYLAAHPDVARASVEPFRHYLAHGIREGRRLGVEGR